MLWVGIYDYHFGDTTHISSTRQGVINLLTDSLNDNEIHGDDDDQLLTGFLMLTTR